MREIDAKKKWIECIEWIDWVEWIEWIEWIECTECIDWIEWVEWRGWFWEGFLSLPFLWGWNFLWFWFILTLCLNIKITTILLVLYIIHLYQIMCESYIFLCLFYSSNIIYLASLIYQPCQYNIFILSPFSSFIKGK